VRPLALFGVKRWLDKSQALFLPTDWGRAAFWGFHSRSRPRLFSCPLCSCSAPPSSLGGLVASSRFLEPVRVDLASRHGACQPAVGGLGGGRHEILPSVGRAPVSPGCCVTLGVIVAASSVLPRAYGYLTYLHRIPLILGPDSPSEEACPVGLRQQGIMQSPRGLFRNTQDDRHYTCGAKYT
jgi:hypothetical protein